MDIANLSDIEKLKLVFYCIDEKLKEENYFFCFNNVGKFKYSTSELIQLDTQAGIEFQEFSELVHQIPNSKSINTSSNNSMWREYEKIFFCGIIPELEKFDLAAMSLGKAVSSKNILSQKEIAYNSFIDKDEELKFEMFDLFNSNEEDAISRIDQLKLQMKENFVNWKDIGYKDEIEEMFDERFAESNFSVIRLWSTWKQRMLYAENAGFKGINSKFASFYANFRNLTSDLNWRSIKMKVNDKLFASEDLGQLAKKISALRVDYQILNIDRDWLIEDVFDADFWQWHPDYDSDLLSYGMLDDKYRGELPSFIQSVVFVKNITYRPKSNYFLDLLEWVGRFFKEIPHKPLLENNENHSYLLAFKSKKIPLSPKNVKTKP